MNLDQRLLRQLRHVRGWFALTIFLGAAIGVLIIVQAYTLSDIIAQVFLHGATLAHVWRTMLVLLAIIAARAAMAWASEVAAFRVAARVKLDLRERVFDHLMALGPAYARGERTGELTNTVVEGIEQLEAYYSQYLPQLVLAALVPLMILVFVFPLDPLSGLVLLLTGPLIPFFMILIGQRADALTRQQYRDLSLLSAHFLDVLQGLTTLKLFGRSREQIDTIARVSYRFRDATLSVLRVAFLSAFALEMIATISTAVVAVEVGLRLLYGQMQFEQAFFVLILAPDFYLPLRLLGTRFHAAMSSATAGTRVFEILETSVKSSEWQMANGEKPITRHPSLVTFRDVYFAYADDRTALNGVSFEITSGQRVALVGATGAGKSTLAHLLLRFAEPTRGEILIDGVPLQMWSPQEWRAQVAWVPQNPYLFDESIADNIRLGRPNAPMDRVIHAAHLAYADEFIHTLPNGYDTVIGERGARLSAGQAQRIALARAFLKDSPFLLLDEATSNLDVESEALIRDAIEHLMRGRTTLMITHRLTTAMSADQIIVLENGRVIETGTHPKLMELRGAYHRLVTARGGWRGAQLGGDIAGDVEERIVTDLPITDRKSEIENLATRRSPLATLLYLAAPFQWWIALAVLLGSLTIGSNVGLMAASAYIIASAALHPSIADLAVPIVGVRFFGIARGVFRYLERYVSHYVNFNLLARLRVWFYSAVEPLAPARLMRYRSGDLLTRIVGDIETLQNFYVRVLAPPLVAFVVAAFMALFLAGYSTTIAAVVLLFMFLVGVMAPIIARWMSQAANRRLILVRVELKTRLVDGIQGIAEVLAFGRAQSQADRVSALSRELARLQTRMASITGLHNAGGHLLTHLAMWVTLVIAIPLVAGGQLNGVYLAVLALAVLMSFEGALGLPVAFQYVDSNLQSARRLFGIAGPNPTGSNLPKTNPVSSPTHTIPQLHASQDYIVHVVDLSFRYTPGDPLALDHVSFELPAGKRLAIVGPSGAGKSTIANLLLRLWDYDAGQIRIRDRELLEYAPDEVRRLFAVVPQPTHLFNASVRDNLLLARPQATQAEMVRATQRAQIHDFIVSLPRGYDTRIGEQGLRLSGGERQRLAIARALLKDAPMMLLDEPTANLDTLTEREVLRALRAATAGKTTLLITHRLVGLEDLDEIIVMRAGYIVERGTHTQLLESNGLYRRMWNLQNSVLATEGVTAC